MAVEDSRSPNSPHRFLAGIVGGWAGKTLTWLEPDGTPSEAQTQGSVQLILDGRFALYLYQSSMDGEPLHGLYTFGYNTTLDRYETSWVDSFHINTAIMFCVGEAKGSGFWVLGSYPDPSGGPDWGWRTEVELVDRDHLSITSFNISPEGGEAKAAKTQLKRIK